MEEFWNHWGLPELRKEGARRVLVGEVTKNPTVKNFTNLAELQRPMVKHGGGSIMLWAGRGASPQQGQGEWSELRKHAAIA